MFIYTNKDMCSYILIKYFYSYIFFNMLPSWYLYLVLSLLIPIEFDPLETIFMSIISSIPYSQFPGLQSTSRVIPRFFSEFPSLGEDRVLSYLQSFSLLGLNLFLTSFLGLFLWNFCGTWQEFFLKSGSLVQLELLNFS